MKAQLFLRNLKDRDTNEFWCFKYSNEVVTPFKCLIKMEFFGSRGTLLPFMYRKNKLKDEYVKKGTHNINNYEFFNTFGEAQREFLLLLEKDISDKEKELKKLKKLKEF